MAGSTIDPSRRQAKTLAGVARGARAAIVVPSLFALGLLFLKQPQTAGFSVFGTFAHLVVVDYGATRVGRATQAAVLTAVGSALLCVGALASASVWTAVSAAASMGLLSEYLLPRVGVLAIVRTALLLTFMLAVAVPTPLNGVLPQLVGWLLAGLVAQLILQVIWIPIRPGYQLSEARSSRPHNGYSQWLGNGVSTALAMGLAVLIARILHVQHAFWIVLGVIPILSARGTSPTRTFWHEQAGTLLGFLIGGSLVAVIGTHQAWYWTLLPCATFFAAYASTAIGFVAGQIGFTVFAVILFCILSPDSEQTGTLRVEDIAIGGTLSLVVASLQRFAQRLLTTSHDNGGSVRRGVR